MKAIISGPGVALIIFGVVVWRYSDPLSTIFARLKRAKIFGHEIEVYAPQQLPEPTEQLAPVSSQEISTPAPAVELPPDLRNDPLAPNSIAFIKNDAIQTYRIFSAVTRELHFERIFSNIFGTQISLLEQLQTDSARLFTNEQLSHSPQLLKIC
ncbi:MAG: hypothetical protein ABJB01_05485 [Rudaea sp.]